MGHFNVIIRKRSKKDIQPAENFAVIFQKTRNSSYFQVFINLFHCQKE